MGLAWRFNPPPEELTAPDLTDMEQDLAKIIAEPNRDWTEDQTPAGLRQREWGEPWDDEERGRREAIEKIENDPTYANELGLQGLLGCYVRNRILTDTLEGKTPDITQALDDASAHGCYDMAG